MHIRPAVIRLVWVASAAECCSDEQVPLVGVLLVLRWLPALRTVSHEHSLSKQREVLVYRPAASHVGDGWGCRRSPVMQYEASRVDNMPPYLGLRSGKRKAPASEQDSKSSSTTADSGAVGAQMPPPPPPRPDAQATGSTKSTGTNIHSCSAHALLQCVGIFF